MQTLQLENILWHKICHRDDLLANAGVAALYKGQQIALFYLPEPEPRVYAIANWDPIAQANVLSRGLLVECDGKLAVASPLYKQHFCLKSGQCIEQAVTVSVWPVKLIDHDVWLAD